jgi:hypothetical protein
MTYCYYRGVVHTTYVLLNVRLERVPRQPMANGFSISTVLLVDVVRKYSFLGYYFLFFMMFY